MTAAALERERAGRIREDSLRRRRREEVASEPVGRNDIVRLTPCGSEHMHRPWRVLRDGPCCLLVATSIAQRDPHLPRLVGDLAELLTLFPWARALLNVFSYPAQSARAQLSGAFRAAHPHLVPSFVGGFKTLFWQTVLRPTVLAAFTHLFLFDSDMVVRPSS